MLSPVIVIWSILLLIALVVLLFVLKQAKRKLGKYDKLFRLGYVLLSFGGAYLVYSLVGERSEMTIALSRCALLLVGLIDLIVMLNLDWAKRDVADYEEDSFLVESIYFCSTALTASLAFVAAPLIFELIPHSDDLALGLWDAPLVYFLPFIILKLVDAAGQVPLKEVSRPWLFPIERINPEGWPWRDLMQVNFLLHRSLNKEYDLFAWPSRPWIEAPQEVGLGEIFRLCIQMRRDKSDYSSIQDMGDEYDGAPRFCWAFYKRRRLVDPSSWFSGRRYLDPGRSVKENGLKATDVVVAQRIIGNGTAPVIAFSDGNEADEMEKTVLIQRRQL